MVEEARDSNLKPRVYLEARQILLMKLGKTCKMHDDDELVIEQIVQGKEKHSFNTAFSLFSLFPHSSPVRTMEFRFWQEEETKQFQLELN